MPGDQLDIFGDPQGAGWLVSAARPYDFLSEGDNVAFNPLLDTGIEAPENPMLGGWGGRPESTTSARICGRSSTRRRTRRDVEVPNYTTLRWAAAAQNDFAARMQWTLTPRYRSVTTQSCSVAEGAQVRRPSRRAVRLRGSGPSPIGDRAQHLLVEVPRGGHLSRESWGRSPARPHGHGEGPWRRPARPDGLGDPGGDGQRPSSR